MGKTYLGIKCSCACSINSPQSEPQSPDGLPLMPGFSLFIFPWVMLGGATPKKVSSATRETKYLLSLNSSCPVCSRTVTDCCVVARREVKRWTSRKASGLTGNCLGVQRNTLDGKCSDEASIVLGSVDSAGHGCVQTNLKRSVIISLGECLAFVGF